MSACCVEDGRTLLLLLAAVKETEYRNTEGDRRHALANYAEALHRARLKDRKGILIQSHAP